MNQSLPYWLFFAGALLLGLTARWLSLPPGEPFFGIRTVPDSYMHLIRHLETAWWQPGPDVIDRANWPYGEVLHWTSAFDWLLAILAAPLRLFMAPPEATEVTGWLISYLCLTGTALAVLWVMRPFSLSAGVFAACLILTQPPLWFYGLLGRVDHHSFLVLACALCAVWLADAARNPLRGHSAALSAGFAGALALWISPEAVPWLAGSISLFVLWRILQGTNSQSADKTGFFFAGSFAGITALLWRADPPATGLFVPETDRLSIIYAAFAAGAAITVAAHALLARTACRIPVQTGLIAAIGGVLGMGWLSAFPQLLDGIASDMPPELAALWLQNVREMQPVDQPHAVVQFLGLPVIALLALAYLIWDSPGHRLFAAAYGGFLACLIVIAQQHLRFALYPALAAAPVLALCFYRIANRIEPAQRGWPVYAAIALLAVPWLAGEALKPAADTAIPTSGFQGLADCPQPILTEDLRALARSTGPLTVFAAENAGPAILYHTPHRIVAGPYHRSVAALRDMFDLYLADTEATIEAITTRREADIIVVCLPPETVPGDATISDGAPYVVRTALAGGNDRWRLYDNPRSTAAGVYLLIRTDARARDSEEN